MTYPITNKQFHFWFIFFFFSMIFGLPQKFNLLFTGQKVHSIGRKYTDSIVEFISK